MRGIKELTFIAVISAPGYLCACGGSAVADKVVVKSANQTEVRTLGLRLDSQGKKISELEVRLALLEGQTSTLGAILREDKQDRAETVTIGARKAREPKRYQENSGAREPEDDGRPRPLLRLYGRGPESTAAQPLVLPPSPGGLPDRLPVVPLPGAGNVREEFSAAGGDSPNRSEASIMDQYRNALSLIRGRRFDDALKAFSDFIEKYPEHAYTDNALYWRGEVLYVKKDYEQAMRQFQHVTERFPSSAKLPDSLLKIGMCHRRLGDAEKASVFFQRVLRQYPDSKAARIASREDAS